MNLKDTYKAWRDYSAVKRYHVMRTLRTQTVGEHSHGVAVLVMQVAPACTAALLKAALTHDFHERATGDMPSTAKWLYPRLAYEMNIAEENWLITHDLVIELSPQEQSILKFCDYTELLLWCIEEFNMGNRYAIEPIVNICFVLDKFTMPTPEAESLYHYARLDAINCVGDLFTQYKEAGKV